MKKIILLLSFFLIFPKLVFAGGIAEDFEILNFRTFVSRNPEHAFYSAEIQVKNISGGGRFIQSSDFVGGTNTFVVSGISTSPRRVEAGQTITVNVEFGELQRPLEKIGFYDPFLKDIILYDLQMRQWKFDPTINEWQLK